MQKSAWGYEVEGKIESPDFLLGISKSLIRASHLNLNLLINQYS